MSEPMLGDRDYDKTRPVITQLPGWRPGFLMVVPASMYDMLAASGYDLTDIHRSQPIPGIVKAK